MLLRNHTQLENLLVKALAEATSLTVHELKQRIHRWGEHFSTAAYYKELTKLREQGVVVKHKQRYSLNLAWISDLLDFAQRTQQSFQSEEYFTNILPTLGKTQSWRFYSLLAMDDFWTQLILTLFNHSASQCMYEWIPHPWFLLVHHEKEQQLQDAMRRMNCHAFSIIGGDSYLDRLILKVYEPDVYTVAFAPSPFEKQRCSYIQVIDDLVLTIELHSQTAREIDHLYDTTQRGQEANIAELLDLLTARSLIKVELCRKPRKAQRLIKTFHEYFGS